MSNTVTSSLKILLEQLASQANLPSLTTSGPVLPDGWVVLTILDSKPSRPYVPIQGILAAGPNEDGDLVLVLSFGMLWSNFYKNNTTGYPLAPNDFTRLSSDIIGKTAPSKAMVMTVFADAYSKSRNDIWNVLGFITEDYSACPLYTTGMGLAAPVAQLCAMDMRAENTGPLKQDAPKMLDEGCVFSAPKFAKPDFVSYYNLQITKNKFPAQCTVWAASQGLIVDFFPLNGDCGYLGELKYMDTVSIPKYDVPWWERSDVYYLQQLGGEPTKNSVIPVTFSTLPTDFSRNLSYTLSLMVAATYQRAQHPDSLVINIAPYEVYKTITSAAAFATIFQSPDSVVVAFRGSISFQEFYTYNCKSTYASLSFIDNSSVYVHAGAAAIYNLPVEGASTTVPTTLAEAIIAELKTIAPNKNVYLTGHDIGGAVASIAATDYALNDCGFQLKALYTFGSTLLSTISFKTLFDAHVGSKSYQLVRLQDKLHNAIQALGYFTIMNPITMNGQLEIEESTYHSLTGYIGLLNPNGIRI
ncbi:hypothetical protein M8998_01605 [Sphingobacterium sp. lm-10]|uniref:lipase family protein n=1 Tax=Sphingobacterium sp. lm-10 TaxID=2944904 RepID=UPI00202274B6|nr:hypothetical protein [Sphingobacterium sp. lm-10]MCL7986626.1 hypothetical protein [Sphingobacterium sp. lm-10]